MSAIDHWYENTGSVTRTDSLEIVNMKVNPITREPASFKEECMSVATDLYNRNPDLHLALSGGTESQLCLLSFLSAGIKPNIVILEFPRQLNSYDTEIAFNTCKYLGITPRVLTLGQDISMNRVRELSVKYQTYNFTHTMMAHYLAQVDTSVILTDKINIRRGINPKLDWCFVRNESTNMWPLRYNELNKNKIISDFFTNTPEQILSFLRIPVLQQLIQKQYSGKISLNSTKHKIYQQGGFDQLRFYDKTNVVENISKLNKKANDIIDQELKFRQRNMYIEYQHLVDSLTNGGVTCQYI
jgi:hypothetical protein